jgi:hypothetical protein
MINEPFKKAGVLLRHLTERCDGMSVTLSYEDDRFVYTLSAERLYFYLVSRQQMTSVRAVSVFAESIAKRWEEISDGRFNQVPAEGIEDCLGDNEVSQGQG